MERNKAKLIKTYCYETRNLLIFINSYTNKTKNAVSVILLKLMILNWSVKDKYSVACIHR